jgi:hypothetical protein
MSSLRLIGDFGPPAVRSYVNTRRKARWWPVLAAFGAGAACFVLVYGPPAHRAEVQTALHVYEMPKGPQPDYVAPVTLQTPVALQAQPTAPEPAKAQADRSVTPTDHATGLPALELISGPETAQSSEPTRHVAAKRHQAASRHVATKSRRHERHNAYARYYAPGRYGYYGGYSTY